MKKSLILAAGTVSSREVKPSSAGTINDVHGMLDRYAPHVVFGMNNYGCSGDNYLDVNMPVKGLPVDSVDNLIIAWKECIHNASRAEKGRRSTRQASHNTTHHHEMFIVDRPKYQFNDRQHRSGLILSNEKNNTNRKSNLVIMRQIAEIIFCLKAF
jgi:hypothetical protein